MGHFAVNTAKAREGKADEARKAALALAKYIKDTYGGNVQILASFDGNRSTLHWVTFHESWAAEEETSLKTSQDAKFQELVQNIDAVIDLYNSEWRYYTVVE